MYQVTTAKQNSGETISSTQSQSLSLLSAWIIEFQLSSPVTGVATRVIQFLQASEKLSWSCDDQAQMQAYLHRWKWNALHSRVPTSA
jgi:hypothetical protein